MTAFLTGLGYILFTALYFAVLLALCIGAFFFVGWAGEKICDRIFEDER